ncbi:hypothetical protein E4U24_000592 [Claviceps purpurea]|nr:hypothetical protein E4U17_000284 [Claviceps sp. LM77 group G4]KAG6057128.1 hypothetical protein E4U33_007544 [Claviceps sp. LM78 group G4]KAG6068306.1 hypothetical protein E4U16_007977 [Claviceps sp. LM84 group G4]KAG6139172.1 hypothetical protein E4U12_007620 [Claviceps purpurea]KAG6232955.1 hypothetical protein E4U24_000592 [Claviceps purpurea]
MATTPALSPEPPTYLCPKLSTKMQIVAPSLKPPKACVIGVSKQGENLLFADQNDQPDQPFRNQPSNSQSSNDRPLKESPALRTLRGRPESEATLTLREEILKR